MPTIRHTPPSALFLHLFHARVSPLSCATPRRGDTEAALKHNLEAMQLEDKWGVAVPDTKVYRRAAVQLLERGHDKEQALGLIQRSRLIEGKKFVCER